MADGGDRSENYSAHKTQLLIPVSSLQQQDGQKAITGNEVPVEKGSNEVRMGDVNEGIEE